MTAFSRSLATLRRHGYVYGLALAWVAPESAELVEWQGGGPRRPDIGPRRFPRVSQVGLTDLGWSVARATVLKEST